MAGAAMFGQADLKSLNGSATYTGQATGYYATRNAGSFEAESGRFTRHRYTDGQFRRGA